MYYKYETHAHTSETSRCSSISGAELARFYKSLGYTGLFVTDHFLNGNSWCPREGEWADRIAVLEKGYLEAKAEGDKIGLDVFFAWEYSWRGTDFLIYGLGRDWLLANPDQLSWSVRDYMDRVRADGGLVIQAHPMREAAYIDAIKLIPRNLDGVETMNASRTDFENKAARVIADLYGLPHFAGSDNHVGRKSCLSGLCFERRLADSRELVDIYKEGSFKLFVDLYDGDGNRV